jgi:hypothetical protein
MKIDQIMHETGAMFNPFYEQALLACGDPK